MSKIVTIFGGSGFVGRYIVQRLAHEGWRVRVAVRRPNEAIQLRPYGSVGQVEPVFCNIRNDASVREAMAGSDAVINCVGILVETGRNRFDALHHLGAERIAKISAEQGVNQLVHISAIGADIKAKSAYSRSKANGEAAVFRHFPSATILRPSVIFGTEDQFFNKFAKMTRFGPVLAIVGGSTLMQPVFVDDVARAAVLAVSGKAEHDVYELGGPEVKSLRSLIEVMLDVIKRRRLIVDLPFKIAAIIATMLDSVQGISLGLVTNHILTRDQVKSLKHDNIVSAEAPGFDALGIRPVAMGALLPGYLWPYRPAGQFSDIKASAKNMNR